MAKGKKNRRQDKKELLKEGSGERKQKKTSKRNFLSVLLKGLFFALKNIITPAILLVLLWKLHEPLLLRPLNLYDEGVSVLGAKRVLMGDIPYVDFFTIYTPLKFAWLSNIFSYFGANLLVSRTFFFYASLAGFAMLYFFFKRESNTIIAFLATLTLGLFGLLSLTPTILFAIAIWFSIFLTQRKDPWLPFIGGVLLGLLFLLRLDFGGFVGLSLFLLLLIFFGSKGEWRRLFSVVGKGLLTFFIVVVPAYFWILSQGALGDFIQQALAFPLLGEYQELRHLPWPSTQSVLESISSYSVDFLQLSIRFTWFFWPVPFLAAFLYWTGRKLYLVIKKKKGSLIEEGILVNLLLASFAMAGFFYASHRSDIGHVIFLNVLSSIFLVHLVLCFRQKIWGILLIPFFALALLHPADALFQKREIVLQQERKQYSFFPTPFPQSEENDHLEEVLEYFKDIPRDEKVYVGVKDTSRVFINNVMLPFFLKQPVATKYHELHTGIVTRKDVQMEMINELKKVNHVVLWETFYCEPNKGCESTGVRDLDEYIEENFALIKTVGKYEIMKRK